MKKIKVTTKEGKHDAYSKMIEQIMNHKDYRLTNEVASEISMKLVMWELILGEETLREIIKAYLEK